LAVHDWTKMIVFATGTLGTFLTTFSISLNNHVPAACCVMFAMYALLKVSDDERMGPFDFALSGLCAGWAFCLELPAASFVAGLGFLFLLRDVRGALLCYVPFALLPLVALALLNVIVTGDVLPAYAKFGGPWYEYPGSHWYQDPALPKKGGIDFAEEPLAIYAFHVLIGHHGLFSLTPIWLLSFAGMIVLTRQWFGERETFPAFGMVALGISVVVIAFYIGRSNNYGGFTGGLRWFFWLNPIWLITMVPILDRLALREWGRRLGYALLAITVFSVSYPMWNPWRHPWIYQLCEYTGWLVY